MILGYSYYENFRWLKIALVSDAQILLSTAYVQLTVLGGGLFALRHNVVGQHPVLQLFGPWTSIGPLEDNNQKLL